MNAWPGSGSEQLGNPRLDRRMWWGALAVIVAALSAFGCTSLKDPCPGNWNVVCDPNPGPLNEHCHKECN